MRLMWLPAVLRSAGLTVHEYPGWAERGSPVWGTDNTNPSFRFELQGVACHATAGSLTSTDAGEMRTLWVTGSTSAPAPISQLYLSRSGDWWVGASGRCNHVRVGEMGPLKGYGNYQIVGVEAQNNNLGEPWSPAMLASYQRGVAAILDRLGLPAGRAVAHWEHQDEKSDPKGINMTAFRAEVARLLKEGTVTDPFQTASRYPSPDTKTRTHDQKEQDVHTAVRYGTKRGEAPGDDFLVNILERIEAKVDALGAGGTHTHELGPSVPTEGP